MTAFLPSSSIVSSVLSGASAIDPCAVRPTHRPPRARGGFRRPRCYRARVPLTRSREAEKGGRLADESVVLDGDDMRRTLVRIAHEMVEKNAAGDGPGRLAIVGIHRRGAILARRLHDLLSDLLEREVPHGDLDISFYRDDLGRRAEAPIVHSSHLEFPVDGMTIVIVDDVLYTGRTVRAAIEALFDYGRPARVQLAVLVDRGHRELPI